MPLSGPQSKFTDEEIMAAYTTWGPREASRRIGLSSTAILNRVARIKKRGCTKNERLNQLASEANGKEAAFKKIVEASQAKLLKDAGTRELPHKYREGNSVQELFDNHAIDPEGVTITGGRIAEHGVVTNNRKTGEVTTHVLYAKNASFKPKVELPKWPVIQPATQRPIVYTPKVELVGSANTQRIFLWPDTQIGFYRSVQSGQLTPMHDLAAIDVALQMLRDFRPTRVVILGDLIDLPMLSRWLQLPEFQHTLQPALNYTYLLLANIRSIVGEDCKIDYLAGNHERRMAEYVAKNAIAAHEIRPAEVNLDLIDPVTFVSKAWDWPAWSIPKLLQLASLGIEYSAEYPGGEVWLNDRNVCTHPPEKSTKKEIRANVYHGHIPRATVDTRTIHNRHDSPEFSMVAVPGLMGTSDLTDKSSLSRTKTTSSGSRMNWQQGIGTLLIFDEHHEKYEIGRIKNGWGALGDKQYLSGAKKVK